MPTNITIKGIPDDVYESIRKKAELNHRSINSEVIVNLKKAVQSTPVDSRHIIEQAKKLREKAKGSLSLKEVQLAIEEGPPVIVADTNVIASLWLPNGMVEIADQVMEKDPEWIAPVLWKPEFRNVLALYFRKEIFDLPTILQIMEQAEALMTSNEFQVNSTQVLSFVKDSTCSAYDCEFIALADDAGVPLLTFNQKVLTEFPSLAIHPESFV